MNKYSDFARHWITWPLAGGDVNRLSTRTLATGKCTMPECGSVVVCAVAVRTMLSAFMTLGAERDSVGDTASALRTLVGEWEHGSLTVTRRSLSNGTPSG